MSPFSRRGQATTEWLLLISVLVVAIVAAGYGLAATFAGDMEKLGERTGTVYASGDLAL
ncbi:MAG: hypothetical protein Q8P18_00015 [Pseudomonadota bacterium]|nr:hypothetical protein [Pseudomonadota bacterium]